MYSAKELSSLYENKFDTDNFYSGNSNLYIPVQHIMRIPGKRIRPMLLLLSCDAFGGDVRTALSPAFAMEIFHNFSLVHDDIMDQSDIRRGLPTVHKMFGINAGILSGDVMLAYAYKYLTEVPAEYLPSILSLFNKTAIEIFEGQQMDVDFEKREDVSLDEYLKMVEYKTSVLLACSLQIGAILAKAPVADQQLIYNFGIQLGLSFQITDDLLDAFGDAEKTGKKTGGDILQNKKTYLYLSTQQNCTKEQAAQLKRLSTEPDSHKKVSLTKEIMLASGGYDITAQKANELYTHALNSLQAINIPAEQKTELFKMAELINKRDY
ncbi:MAG: polyprenyl synthetase family protein [Bacteroidetes bacterium]|nr:polyprenyl synthetase family protein [Bacteroidota bacterium]